MFTSQSENSAVSISEDEIDQSSLLRIMVATDNHLGHLERDRVRREDSFITFEEILIKAQENNVDLLLLGGDLFDANKPSRYTLYRTLEMLRNYTKGDRPVPLKIHSDQKQNFQNGKVNYEDPDQNISLPIFMIHGNHDDPTGEHSLSAIDLLSVNNVVNYFGKADNVDEIRVNPILLSKGSTKLALYGLGHIRDERLYRAFTQKRIKFSRPKRKKEQWFNIFVTHQNRHKRNLKKGAISESLLRGFLDIVVWGHEHECLIDPSPSAEGDFEVIQPGSSTITSLVPEEEKQKKICILEVYGESYRSIPLELKTVRPFVMDSIKLADCSESIDRSSSSEEIADFLAEQVEEMIRKAQQKTPSIEEFPPKLRHYHESLSMPLIRLKVDYNGGFETVNPHRFGQRFVNRVANPSDILLFSRPKSAPNNSTKSSAQEKVAQMIAEGKTTNEAEGIKIEDIVAEILQDTHLSLLNEEMMTDSVSTYVQKEEAQAINDFVSKQLRSTQKKVWTETKTLPKRIESEDVSTLVDKISNQRKVSRELLLNKKMKKLMKEDNDNSDDENENNNDEDLPDSGISVDHHQSHNPEDEEDEEEETATKKSSRGRGRGRGRGKGRGRGRGKKTSSSTSSRKTSSSTTTRKSTRAKTRLQLTNDDDENDENDDNDNDNEQSNIRSKSSSIQMMDIDDPFANDEGDFEQPPSKRKRTTRKNQRSNTKQGNDDEEPEEIKNDSQTSSARRIASRWGTSSKSKRK